MKFPRKMIVPISFKKKFELVFQSFGANKNRPVKLLNAYYMFLNQLICK